MKNSWLKKNQMLSIWFSGANVTGTARGRAVAKDGRPAANAAAAMTTAATDLWTSARMPKPACKRTAKRRTSNRPYRAAFGNFCR